MRVWLVAFYIEEDSPQPFAYPYKVRVDAEFSDEIYKVVEKAEHMLRSDYPDAYIIKVVIADDTIY